MSDGFTFVHCADLHLDSPFEGVRSTAPSIAEVLCDATFRAFENVIDLAIRKRADFLVVAGDVYDGADRSLRAQLRFRDGLRRAAENGVQCFVSHGNHDPLTGWEAGLALPPAVHRFGGDVEGLPVERCGAELARVYGVSYRVRNVQENLSRRFKADSGGPFSIGVLHCNVGGDPRHDNYAPCTVDDLAASGIDYWALGHIHSRSLLRQQGPCIAQPGNTQGRSVRETGPRGCYLVHVDAGRRVANEFVPTDVVRWFVQSVDIAGLDTLGDLMDVLFRLREDVRGGAEGRASVLRLEISGRGNLHAALAQVDPDRDLALPLRENEPDRTDFVWVESVDIRTRRGADPAQRRRVDDFPGDFLRRVESMRASGEAPRALREMMAAWPEYRLVARHVEFSDDDLLSILDEAEAWGLDHLLGEE